jgi:hypothetical protein
MTKQIDATWAAGDAAGGLSSSLTAPANSTWYHVHAILVDGSTDVGFDTSVTAANLVADHSATAYRRLGSVLTDGSANITQFLQVGDHFYWQTPVNEFNSDPGTGEQTDTIASPLGVSTLAMLSVTHRTISGTPYGQSYTAVYHPDLTGYTAASTGGAQLRSANNSSDSASEDGADAYIEVYTDTSSQIQHISSANVLTLTINTLGWVDSRGSI